MRAGNCLGGLERWEGWGRSRKNNRGRGSDRSWRAGEGDVFLPPTVICDPDDSAIPDPEKGLDGQEGLPGSLGRHQVSSETAVPGGDGGRLV